MARYIFRGAVQSRSAYEGSTHEGGWDVELRSGEITLKKEDLTRSKDELWPEAKRIAKTFLDDFIWQYGQPLTFEIDICEVSAGDQYLRCGDEVPEMKDGIVYRHITATMTANYEVVGPKSVHHPWSRNMTALKARDYFLRAQSRPPEALWYLYKAVELLKDHYQGWKPMATALGVTQGYIDHVKRLADDTKYDQRHAPKPGESVAQLSGTEIQDCHRRVKDLIDKFAKINQT